MKHKRWLVSAAVFTVSVWLAAASGAQPSDRPRPRAGGRLPSGSDLPDYVAVIRKAFDLASYWQFDQAMAQFDQHLQIQGDSRTFRNALADLYRNRIESDGIEIAAIREVSLRVHIVYVLVYLEPGPKLVILRTYRFRDDWRITDFRFDADIADLEAEVRVTPVLRGFPKQK